MTGSKLFKVAALAALLMAHSLSAGEPARLSWQTDPKNAWKTTKENGRPLLIFVTSDHCYHCTQMKKGTFANDAVVGTINRSFVPLTLDGRDASPLLKELKVSAFPATFVVSPQAVILMRIDGYVPPETLVHQLNALRAPLPVAKVAK